MRIANIFPIANQKLYASEDFVMILAHLIDKYKPYHFQNGQYIIMDNGLFEGAQVSTSLQACIDLAEASGIPVSEIIIPDAVNDPETTKKLFIENLPTIEKYQHKYRFMFVAQAKNPKELKDMINFINKYKDYNLAVGISKLSPMDRGCWAAIKQYKRCAFPIHFLGIKESFIELMGVFPFIRSCDTSQLAFMDKNQVWTADPDAVLFYERRGEDIDLAKDKCDNIHLIELRYEEREAMAKYGIL